MTHKIAIECTFTESPSFNVRVVDSSGGTIFYNSERLWGNDRTRALGKLLGLKELRIGTRTMEITEEKLQEIIALDLRMFCEINEKIEKRRNGVAPLGD
jgi:hypothetical protein